MFCKNLRDKVSRMKKTEVAIFLLFRCCSSWCTPFFRLTHFSWRKSWNKMACFEFFKKKLEKSEKYRAKQGSKIKEKHFFPSHPSSRAVRAGRFGPPNFFCRPPESGLISHTSCVIYDGGRPPETGHVTRS